MLLRLRQEPPTVAERSLRDRAERFTTRYPSRHPSPSVRRFLFVIKGFSNIGSRRMISQRPPTHRPGIEQRLALGHGMGAYDGMRRLRKNLATVVAPHQHIGCTMDVVARMRSREPFEVGFHARRQRVVGCILARKQRISADRWHSVEVENAPSGGSSSHETSECQYSPAMRLELASAWMVGEIVRVDIFQSNEHPRDAGSLRLRDEVFDFVAKSVDLDHQAERNPALLPEFD